jgi:thiol-disulfide isomerase/thioredoxin
MQAGILISLLLTVAVLDTRAQDVSVVKFEAVQSLIDQESEKVVVINFWATWCGPCIKEMPYFEQALEDRPEEIELYFISLDFADELDKVRSFAARKSLDARILILDELDYDTWIDRVDPSWSGAIPATLFINTSTGERKFVESELTPEEIETHINALL